MLTSKPQSSEPLNLCAPKYGYTCCGIRVDRKSFWQPHSPSQAQAPRRYVGLGLGAPVLRGFDLQLSGGDVADAPESKHKAEAHSG